eukprot:4047012-Pyramimonas_sp.AAC.1
MSRIGCGRESESYLPCLLAFFWFPSRKGGTATEDCRRRFRNTSNPFAQATTTTFGPAMARGAACRFGPSRGRPLVPY